MELHSGLCARMNGRAIWGRMDTCVCTTESLLCSPETATSLLMGCACVLSLDSCVQFFATLWTIARLAPLFLGFSRQDYCNGLSCPPPGDFPNPGIEPMCLMSPTLEGGFLITSTTYTPIQNRKFKVWKKMVFEKCNTVENANYMTFEGNAEY